MGARVGGVVPSVRFRIWAGFSNQSFYIKILGIVGNDGVKVFKVFEVVRSVFGVFVPGDKIQSNTVVCRDFEQRFYPVAIVGSDGRSTDFKVASGGTIGHGL